jgi:hypothetical protein
MQRHWLVFVKWFTVLMVFFVFANTVGYIHSLNLKLRSRETGFPLTFVAWGKGKVVQVDFLALIINAEVAITISCVAALACTASRFKRFAEVGVNDGSTA